MSCNIMENLVKLFYDWEIQLLVVLSFTIQIFLFFTGGLRRRSTSPLIRLSIWIAYLGADTVAIYALGYLSRQEEDAHSLAFFWAPFLLVHLGGQDTITAFALEDNNLWLRHLLNLVVQVVLAVYVFWKSIERHSVKLLVSGALVFVVGVIKYGERTWSLMCARIESLEGSYGHQYEPPVQVREERTDYCSTVLDSIFEMPNVFSIFVSRTHEISEVGRTYFETRRSHMEKEQRLKSMEICLGLMYDDLYTKAPGLRTMRGVLLRCISQVCALVAFIVFVTCNRRRYGRVDTAITFSLFIGCLLLEVCGLFRLMASPWTWVWTRACKKVLKLCVKLDEFNWFLLSNNLTGWSHKRPLWSNAMGQYNFYGWVKGSDEQEQDKQPRYSFSQQCMTVVRRLATLFGLEKEKIFFISKLLDREHVKVDGLVECLLDGVDHFVQQNAIKMRNLDSVFSRGALDRRSFGRAILIMHTLTERLLCKSAQHPDEASNINLLMEECRKLSRYVVYLMIACPSLLPLQDSSAALLEQWQQHQGQGWGLSKPIEELVNPLRLDKETLEEIKEVWIRLIVYAASKSRPEQHAAQLARGGELLTFVWLHLSFKLVGAPIWYWIELTNDNSFTLYALDRRLTDS